MDINVFNILSYFVIYSFLGWILESVFRSFCERKIINTGFLIGPFCPIYGTGALIMYFTLGFLKDNPVLVFFVSVIMLTLWEYIVGVFLEKVFKTKYWDYSDHKIQFQGRICLSNSIAWGFLGVGFIIFIHPFVVSVIEKVDFNIMQIIIYSATVVAVIDTIVSVIKAKNIKIKLKKMEALNEEIKQKMSMIKDKTQKAVNEDQQEKNKEKNKVSENIQHAIRKLSRKRDKMMIKMYRYARRIKKAFPKLNSQEITEVLNKKVTFKKKEKEK